MKTADYPLPLRQRLSSHSDSEITRQCLERGEDVQIASFVALAAMGDLTKEADDHAEAASRWRARAGELAEALIDWQTCWLCPATNFEAEVPRLLDATDDILTNGGSDG